MKTLSSTRMEVEKVAPPPATKTWKPVAHGELLSAMDIAVAEAGYSVKNERYTMTRNGRRLFGSWVLDVGNGLNWMIGFRHGNDKTLKMGFCAGTWVMVCSNMCFSGQFFEFRMHTTGLNEDELNELVKRAIGSMPPMLGQLTKWQESLKRDMLQPMQFKALSFDLLRSGIVKPVQFDQYIAGVDEERKAFTRAKDLTPLYAVHGGVTRMLREHHIGLQQVRTAKLNTLIDEYKKAA